MLTAPGINASGFYGLAEETPGLPAGAYFDPGQFERELQRIWYRNWIYVGRSSLLARARDYQTFEIGDQKILLVRDEDGILRGFHNTCRHRGSALCREPRGRLRSGSLVCPYHGWVYSLEGELLRTSSKSRPRGFDTSHYSLYPVRVTEWRGCIFLSLAADPPPLESNFDQPLGRLDAWPLGELVTGHVLTKVIRCNWKVFWENYNECLHCPGVHPQLSQLVPLFGRALLEERDDPDWSLHARDEDPKFKGGLRRGAATWSLDGQVTGPEFSNISQAARQAGQVYMTGLPSVFLVGHVDYVRVVRLRPLAPELTELAVEYLFAPGTLEDPRFDLANIVEFTDRVMTEDADICELNQRGLHAAPHVRGVVMPEEYLIAEFHRWLHSELGRV